MKKLSNTEAKLKKKCCLYIKACTGSVKTEKWNLNFQNLSKGLCLGVSEPTKRWATQSAAYALRNRPGEQAFVKKNEKKISV